MSYSRRLKAKTILKEVSHLCSYYLRNIYVWILEPYLVVCLDIGVIHSLYTIQASHIAQLVAKSVDDNPKQKMAANVAKSVVKGFGHDFSR